MNKIIIIGNLTRDPQLRSINNGASVCSFSVAVNRRFADNEGNRGVDYFNVSAWRALGENCNKFLKKGSKVAVSGEVQVRQYDDKDGVKRTSVDINADEVEFLTPKMSGGDMGDSGSSDAGMQPVEDDNLPF